MRAIKIDPEQGHVEALEIEPTEIAGLLKTETIETIDFEPGHCLVIDDGDRTIDHPMRFRFHHGPVWRPFFGSVLILGISNGNWVSATVEPSEVSAMLIWEEWDPVAQQYALPAVSKN